MPKHILIEVTVPDDSAYIDYPERLPEDFMDDYVDNMRAYGHLSPTWLIDTIKLAEADEDDPKSP